MGETSDRIEERIEEERGDLDVSLREVESKIQVKTDWFRRNSALLRLAFGGGVLLSLLASPFFRA